MYSTDEIKQWSIYKITNPNGSIYIGRSFDLKGRLNNYKWRSGRVNKQPLLYKSLLEFGYSEHKVEVIDTFESNYSYAYGKEIFWIRTNMSNYVKYPEQNGLNCGDGGEGAFGSKRSEEVSKKLSDLRKGVKKSDKYIKGLIERSKNKPSPMDGKKHSDESKNKMSLSKKGKPHHGSGKISVDIFNEDGSFVRNFISIKQAAEFLGKTPTITRSVLNGHKDFKLNGFLLHKK